MKSSDLLWGIDMGGTKIEGVVLNSHDFTDIVCRKRIPTEADQGYEHVLGRVETLIGLMEKVVGSRPDVIGMGTPGVMDPVTKTLKNSNTVHLNGKPFKSDLESRLDIRFSMANDANCFALAETLMGVVSDQSPDAGSVFGVIMGTGVGGGIVINQKVHTGKQGIGGEWGHTYLDDSGGFCWCGKKGCVETLISGPALESFYESKSGNNLPLQEIVLRYRIGDDPDAEETINRLIHFFGKGLSNVINILDPDVVVLGGGVGNIDELYTQGVEKLKQFVFNTDLQTKVVPPKLGDSAGVFGAALLVK